METSFLPIKEKLRRANERLDAMEEAKKIWFAADFDPISFEEVPDFPRIGATADDLFLQLFVNSPDFELEYQITTVARCLAHMESAIRLIELQSAYKQKLSSNEAGVFTEDLDELINNDSTAYINLSRNIIDFRERCAEYENNPLEDTNYREERQKLDDAYEKAQGGYIRYSFNHHMTAESIAKDIFETKRKALKVSLDATDHLLDRIYNGFKDYAAIRVAKDEGIVLGSDDLDKLAQEKVDLCNRLIPRAGAALNILKQYACKLQEMGWNLEQGEEFPLSGYKDLTMQFLPRFTP